MPANATGLIQALMSSPTFQTLRMLGGTAFTGLFTYSLLQGILQNRKASQMMKQQQKATQAHMAATPQMMQQSLAAFPGMFGSQPLPGV